MTSSRRASAILHAVSHVIYHFRLLSLPSSPFFLRFRTSKLFYRFIGSDIRKFQRFSNPSDVLFASLLLSIRLNALRQAFRRSFRRIFVAFGRIVGPFSTRIVTFVPRVRVRGRIDERNRPPLYIALSSSRDRRALGEIVASFSHLLPLFPEQALSY